MGDALERQVASFTNEQKEMMASFLRRKKEYEQQIADIQVKVMEMHSGYCTIFNSRSPILLLPNEVTCLIFDYAQLPGGLDQSGHKRENDWYLMEVVLSHVCQHWRSIALGYPNLWTKFYYTFDSEGRQASVPLKRFEVYLRRSGTLPLYLWFDFREDSDNLLNAQLLNQSIDHVGRWKQFTLYASGNSEVEEWLSQLQNLRAPLLECLILAPGLNGWDSIPPVNFEAAIFTGGAPNLKFCTLVDEHAFRNLIPPLSNITILRIHTKEESNPMMKSQVVINLLSLPLLQHLSLIGNFGLSKTPVPQIKMPSLERLQVSRFDGMWFYLPWIRAPRLESLVIHGSQFTSDPRACRLDQYSFPSLRKLWIANSSMDERILGRFGKLTSEATNIFIASSKSKSFLHFVCSYFDKENLWPRLTVMTASLSGSTTIELYMAFARSRSKPFTFRLHPKLLSRWKDKLGPFCRLEPICEENSLIYAEPFWPKYMEIAPGFDARYDYNDLRYISLY